MRIISSYMTKPAFQASIKSTDLRVKSCCEDQMCAVKRVNFNYGMAGSRPRSAVDLYLCVFLQGPPKVRSSNFMHYNFWSKLYFYMKFLKDVYFSTEYMHSEFQLLACAFWFFIIFCSRCGMKWDRACRPTDDPFWAFLSPGAQEPVHPQIVFVYFRQLKKYILGIHPKKIMIPASFHSKAFEYFFTNLRPAGRYLAE